MELFKIFFTGLLFVSSVNAFGQGVTIENVKIFSDEGKLEEVPIDIKISVAEGSDYVISIDNTENDELDVLYNISYRDSGTSTGQRRFMYDIMAVNGNDVRYSQGIVTSPTLEDIMQGSDGVISITYKDVKNSYHLNK